MFVRSIVMLSIVTFTLSAYGSSDLQAALAKSIQKLGVHDSELAVLVVDSKGEAVYAKNADRLMIPASLTKILTAAAVLSEMPADIKWKTQVLSNSKIQDEKIKGDICLVGGGDPAFVSENMWVLVNRLVRQKFNTVTGDIVVDASRFDAIKYDSGRNSKRVIRSYDAPVEAISFNWNSVNIYIRPGKKIGELARVWLDPVSEYLKLDNRLVTTRKSKKIQIERIVLKDGKNIFRIRGSLPVGTKEKIYYRSISHPALWAGYNFKSFLKQRNIHVQGKVRAGHCDLTSKLLAEVDSKPLSRIIMDMMKFSNNFVAEMLTKNMATDILHQMGNIKDGMKVIEKYLSKLKIEKNTYTFHSVSGLSRENRFSVRQIWKVLNDVNNEFRVSPEFLSALPVAGIDGTLKSRLTDSGVKQLVRAKTGLLNGVVGLAGYASSSKGNNYQFVLLYNGKKAGMEWRIRKGFDNIISTLVR